MQTRVSQLATQNQDLLEQKLNLQDRLQMETEEHSTDLNRERMAAELRQEMRHCFSELQSLCSVLSKHFQGQDPNISQLLGIQSEFGVKVPIRRFVFYLRSMRRDLDELRALVCDRYAQSMAENCHLQ
uniref:Uncharacterized protein n=1 Tax=Eptatretus burgeri TaxID=7764 RepID=A0A8C4NF46_EPTBU